MNEKLNNSCLAPAVVDLSDAEKVKTIDAFLFRFIKIQAQESRMNTETHQYKLRR